MIFVTVGTHPSPIDRLFRHLDEIAPFLNEKIIAQTGRTFFKPKNFETFSFTPNLQPYFKQARLVISHAATSILEFSLNHKKPLIVFPRQKKFGEHINDHQVEFANYFAKKASVDAVLDVKMITPEFLRKYNRIPQDDIYGLVKLQSYFKCLFLNINNSLNGH